MCLEHCAHALRRAIPESASPESLRLFRQYQVMLNIVPGADEDTSNSMDKMFDECRASGRTKRLSVIRSGHFEDVRASNHMAEEVLICTLPTSHRCKGYVSSQA